jgi:hypothetical protein
VVAGRVISPGIRIAKGHLRKLGKKFGIVEKEMDK